MTKNEFEKITSNEQMQMQIISAIYRRKESLFTNQTFLPFGQLYFKTKSTRHICKKTKTILIYNEKQ